MKIVKTKKELCTLLDHVRADGKSIGFVPTMGGLHTGHTSLVRRSKAEEDVTVVSLFLNPTQFNNPEDLRTYPHNTQDDLALLESEMVDVAFVPSVEEMYPTQDNEPIVPPLGSVEEVMEGAFRSGHFRGVVQIVSRLFRLVMPDRAYFGEKDFQQVAVIRRMVELMPEFATIEIVPCPTIREKSGLAMSSRNRRLSIELQTEAANIYRVLQAHSTPPATTSVQALHDTIVEEIDAFPHLRVEYLDIVDAETLLSVTSLVESKHIVICTTVFCNNVRLIDHIHLNTR